MAGDTPRRLGRLAISGVTSNSSASAPWPKPTTRILSPALAFSSASTSSTSAAPRRCRRSWRAADRQMALSSMPAALATELGDARQRRRHAEVGDVLGRDLGSLQAALDRRRHDRHVAGVADPALLPAVVELVVDGAEVVDEIGGARGLGQQLGDRLALADQQGRGAVAARHLDGARGLGAALLGGDDQRLAVARRAPRSAPRCRRAGWRRRRWSRHASIEVQRAGDDAGMQPIQEREGGGGKAQRGDVRGRGRRARRARPRPPW